MSKPKAPAPPDYTSAAVASGASSREVTRDQTYANRPEQNTPWGQTAWETYQDTDPATGQAVTRWRQNQTLRPELESALGTEVEQTQYRSGLARDLMGRIAGGLQETPSFDQFGGIGEMRQKAEDDAYGRQTSRLDPQFADRRAQTEIKLRNQGLTPGTEAYDRAMANLGRDETDAYAQARGQATAEGRAETGLSAKLRQQEISEYLQERGVPLNEVNAIMTGQQVSSPQMPSFQNAGRAQAVDYLGAAKSGYQAQLDQFSVNQAGKQSFQSGLFNLAGTGAKLYMGGGVG